MFDRLSDHARQVVVMAQEEARQLRHDYIGTEHILLGLLSVPEGLAAEVLEGFEITVERVEADVARIVRAGPEEPSGPIPFTPRAKKVLEQALREALELGYSYVGTEHILLGLLREDETEGEHEAGGLAVALVRECGAAPEAIRAETLRRLSGPGDAGA